MLVNIKINLLKNMLNFCSHSGNVYMKEKEVNRMNLEINRLIHFALQNKLIKTEDKEYSVNLLLDLLKLDDFHEEEIDESLEVCTPILERMLEYAVNHGIIEDSQVEKDLFDTRIMNCVMPRPSEVTREFQALYKEHPQKATDYFYHMSIACDYIRKSRVDKNIRFQRYYQYGDIEITINLSKPEKDPKDIARAKFVKTSGYPKCLLCKENVGFSGDYQRPARQTHRIIPLKLDQDDYYLQYSPYVYYNEHCIVLNKEHKPMVINEETFRHLLSFVEQFPHYMLGSNADLPIVGGSILTHDHYQGGRYVFPMENAKVIETLKLSQYPHSQIDILYWPLSTVRITSSSKDEIISFANALLKKWREYSCKEIDILAYTGETMHNTITPIARMKNGQYQMDLVLRNNRTSEQYPDGIFHPHPHLHHIKKENIGLIEVMGLAVLPARLKDELDLLKDCLSMKKDIQDYEVLDKHKDWYFDLQSRYSFQTENIDDIIELELTKKFVEVLENAGVFKMDEQGQQAFITFIKSIQSEG